MRCILCGKELDCSQPNECYSDNPNAFTHPHLGGIYCRACYAKTHPFCLSCDNPLNAGWKFCPHCGEGENGRRIEATR